LSEIGFTLTVVVPGKELNSAKILARCIFKAVTLSTAAAPIERTAKPTPISSVFAPLIFSMTI